MHVRSLVTLAAILCLLGAPVAAGAQTSDVCDIVGTEGDDVLIGTDGNDVICGLGGNDLLVGGDGDDELFGGAGDDELQGGPGSDRLLGEDGDDVLHGGRGDDELRGGGGDDEVAGGPGDDVVRGGNGDDALAGGTGNDVLWGGNDRDVTRGGGGDDVLYGGSGADIVRGGDGSDRLRGGPDDDVCIDSFARTNALTCEFGNGGDSNPVDVGRAMWAVRGNDEFVYTLARTTECLDEQSCEASLFILDLIHVVEDHASSASGEKALTASDLFDEASTALGEDGRVVFDASHGLPRVVEHGDGSVVEIREVAFRDELRRRFAAAELRWAEAALTDYSFVETTRCFCPTEPVQVTVVGGTIVLPEQSAPESSSALGQTVEAHFAVLEELLDGHNIVVDATFDEVYGVPTWYAVDVSRAIADDERAVSIDEFAPTQTADVTLDDDSVGDDGSVDGGSDGDTNDVGHPSDLQPQLDIVRVAGIEVSSVIAEDLRSLIDAAALEGLQLSGGGFRDPQRQIELRKVNCGTSDFAIFEMPAAACSPPTARPGRSQHELGLAIDFTSSGHLITSRTDPAFVWLTQHATTYGLVNLPSEPWHWSTTGN